MHQYRATITWQHTNGKFTAGQYSRKHLWHFDGGLEIPASASPQIVPAPYSNPSAVDPEEAFIASLASCHMLWFLSLAAKNNYIVQSYEDAAEGTMEENGEGEVAITKVVLKPEVRFGPKSKPSQRTFDQLHDQAHKKCFIARSVKTEIIIDGHCNHC